MKYTVSDVEGLTHYTHTANSSLSYRIHDIEESNRQYPTSFFIPTLEEREWLTPGTFVQLHFDTDEGGERIWVKVTELTTDGYVGTLANDPVCLDMEYGDTIYFSHRHVAKIQK